MSGPLFSAIARTPPGDCQCKPWNFPLDHFTQIHLPARADHDFVPEPTPTPARRPTWSSLAADSDAYQRYVNAFSRAYQDMLRRPPADPRSLNYQAWLHYYYCGDHGRSQATDVHTTSAFLPWHRAYLYYFERLVQQLSGDASFRLAAWDWENGERDAEGNLKSKVPAAFQQWTEVPGMKDCALVRHFDIDTEDIAEVDDPIGWLQSSATDSTVFQGKADCRSKASAGPHNSVHTSLGEFMFDLKFAALDTVFFSHHANIDRFWEAWRRRYEGDAEFFKNQTWPSGSWIFFDAKTNAYVSVQPSNVLELSNLGYDYDPPRLKQFTYKLLLGSGYRQFIQFNKKALGEFGAALKDAWSKPRSLAHPATAASSEFSLPLLIQFNVPHNLPAGRYLVKLRSRQGRPMSVGGFSILKGHSMHEEHPMQEVTAFLSVRLGDLVRLQDEAANSLQVLCSPRSAPQEVLPSISALSFQLQYPINSAEWDKIL